MSALGKEKDWGAENVRQGIVEKMAMAIEKWRREKRERERSGREDWEV